MCVDVSVVIPTFRRSEYLEEAIESVLKQDYLSIEIIVVDDNADLPYYREIIKRLEKKYINNYSNIKFLYPDKNLGGALARNYGVSHSNATYISFLDDDDYFLENNKISLCIDYLENYNADVAYNFVITSDGELYEKKYSGNYMYHLFREGAIFATSQLTVKRDKFLECGGFENSPSKQDSLLTYNLLKINSRFVCVPYVLNYYRQHNFHRISNSNKALYGELNLLDKYYNEKNNFTKLEIKEIEIQMYERVIKYAIFAKDLKYLFKFISLLILKYNVSGMKILFNNFLKIIRK